MVHLISITGFDQIFEWILFYVNTVRASKNLFFYYKNEEFLELYKKTKGQKLSKAIYGSSIIQKKTIEKTKEIWSTYGSSG